MKTNIITAAVILLLFSVSNITSLFSGNFNLGEPALLGLPLIFLLLIVIAYGFSVKSYQVTSESLLVKRPFQNAVFPRSNIASVVAMDKQEMGFAWRLFGSGGFFGYYGLFASKPLGRFTMYGTQSCNYVLIALADGKKIVLTPDAPEEFVAALKAS